MPRKVLMAVKLMPRSAEEDLELLKKRVEATASEVGELKDIKEEPIAFGLKAIKVLLMVEDEEKIAEKVENLLHNIEGVESVEVESITLI
ncbi:MAG: elongation factor 1-beta [Candidatus Nanohaloarchaeota archaeon]|nr:elongation factor 1-beta [Candidatus Nanohaloarchaeota archaeon]